MAQHSLPRILGRGAQECILPLGYWRAAGLQLHALAAHGLRRWGCWCGMAAGAVRGGGASGAAGQPGFLRLTPTTRRPKLSSVTLVRSAAV